MKVLAGELASILASRGRRRPQISILVRFVVMLALMVVAYSAIFRYLMRLEGHEYTWATAFYWVLTVMSTLGFGDITFTGDVGRMFSILVLVSGTIFLLVLLPFIFIEFFYQPWMARQEEARTPRRLREGTKGHVIITRLGPVTAGLIERLEHYDKPYVLLAPDTQEGLRLIERGYDVVVGPVDDPETYRRVCAKDAEMIVATASDPGNTLIASTVLEVAPRARVVSTAEHPASIDLLELAGCERVLHLPSLMGAALARRVVGGDNQVHVIHDLDGLKLADANTAGTSLVGVTVRECGVREKSGVGIVGVWQRGSFQPAGPDTVITDDSVLLLAGTDDQLEAYNENFADETEVVSRVIIIGGGRIGRRTARELRHRRIEYKIVEEKPNRPHLDKHWVIGNAAELDVLKKAGIDDATTVIITTHDDDVNVYLALYCRKLNPSLRILSRARDPRNVSSIHRAGADFVLSYTSMGAHHLFNSLGFAEVKVVAEGLHLFRIDLPKSLYGKRLAESAIRQRTGAMVVAVEHGKGGRTVNPRADTRLFEGDRVIVIGEPQAEELFLKHI